MSRGVAIGFVVVAVLLVGGWVLARGEKDVPIEVKGPFAVTAGSEATVLLDTSTGQAWVLHQSVRGDWQWMAVTERYDGKVDVLTHLRMDEALQKEIESGSRSVQQ